MKRFLLSLCFVAFLSAGLVACNDEAAEVTPVSQENNLSGEQFGTEDKGGANDTTRPGD